MDLRLKRIDSIPADFPDKYSFYSQEGEKNVPWWHAFESTDLNRLQTMAYQGNLDLQAVWARMRQSWALADKAGAGRLPELNYSATGATLRSKNETGGEHRFDDFSLGLRSTWEVDFWGRVRAESESARQLADAAEDDAYAVELSLSGQIAETWVDLLNWRQQEVQLEEQRIVHNKLLELIEMRFMLSKANALDVYQQAQTVKAIEGGLITVRGQIQLIRHQLALLIGKAPTEDLCLEAFAYPAIGNIPATGIPADLLAARPDIRAAGRKLQAADWAVAAAKADRLPKLQLTASLDYSSQLLDTLLDIWIMRLAAGLTGPIFDGGRRSAEVKRTMAVVDERLANYRQVVLTAIREVEDALAKDQEYRQAIDNIDQQIDLTDKAYREATWRYLNGLSDFLPVLREQVNLITLQLDRIRAGSDLVKARIALHTALGGNLPNDSNRPSETTP